MCSVIWHLDGRSGFLSFLLFSIFPTPRKSVSNVSAAENMEQRSQEWELMQEGGFADCYSAHISSRHTPSPQISREKRAE